MNGFPVSEDGGPPGAGKRSLATILLIILVAGIVCTTATLRDSLLISGVQTSNHELTRLALFLGAGTEARDNLEGATPLMLAVRRRCLPCRRALLAAGADLSATDGGGNLPLGEAAARGDLAAVEDLLVHGADPNQANHSGDTALHSASWTGNPDLVGRILAAGGDPNREATNGPPLERLVSGSRNARDPAAARDYVKSAILLLNAGAETEGGTPGGITPLMRAVAFGPLELVELLLARGAEPNARTKKGYTPLGIAHAMRHMRVSGTECIRIIERYGGTARGVRVIGLW